MTERDDAIMRDIERFHCLSRDNIIDLYFSDIRTPVTCANKVLRRLSDRKKIKADRTVQPYMYFPIDSKMSTNSQKVDHFQAIFKIYSAMRRLGGLRQFFVEPKIGGKGTVEPDIFAIWHGTPFFIEAQLSNYSSDIMLKKIARYEQYRISRVWENLSWQRKSKKVFPIIWIVGQRQYDGLQGIMQTKSVQEMYSKMKRA
ncbi:hypothetical protein NOM01_04615 [Sporolactobacillus sp. STSJ-5]|uniref:hypothetical protein n=1 Tax=Sporolactobacillus sp. STSJ-5 TaxID=2965076 RepID=UPI0021075AF6|nr:hypothetical protein [Sporolactobacillus sp. STSJ-5]MCQ2009277.1 hypothetical protein [Sporolactobacillus sp. STSJ-5]